MDELLSTESHNSGNIYLFDHSMISLGLIAKFPPTLMKKAEVAVTVNDLIVIIKI